MRSVAGSSGSRGVAGVGSVVSGVILDDGSGIDEACMSVNGVSTITSRTLSVMAAIRRGSNL